MTKFSPQRIALLLKQVAEGTFLKTAAASVGISYSTLASWKRRGQKAIAEEDAGKTINPQEKVYAEFARNLALADATAEIFWEGVVREHAFDDGKLALDYMSRRWRQRWATNPPSKDSDIEGRIVLDIRRKPSEDPET